MRNRQEIGHLTTESIKIIDGVGSLPPAPKRHLDCHCHCHCLEHCLCHPIGELWQIFVTVLSYDGLVDSAERDNLITLVLEVASKKNPLSFFKDLFLHFLFKSAEAKLLFVGNAMDYLIDHEDEIEEELGRTWQASYRHFSKERQYDVKQSILGNQYLESVYYYRSGLKVADPNNPQPQPYPDSCTGLLHFLTNVIKHVNEHRRRDGMSKWQAEEKEAVIEKYFPGEMIHIFEFFWCRGLKLDFTRNLRTHAPIY